MGKILGAQWKELTAEEKKPYEDLAKKDKVTALHWVPPTCAPQSGCGCFSPVRHKSGCRGPASTLALPSLSCVSLGSSSAGCWAALCLLLARVLADRGIGLGFASKAALWAVRAAACYLLCKGAACIN